MDLMPASRCLVATLSSSLSSMKAPAICSSQGLKLILTDSVALPARDLNSGSLSLASCAPLNPGNKKQVSAIISIRIFMNETPICGLQGLIPRALIGIRTGPPARVQCVGTVSLTQEWTTGMGSFEAPTLTASPGAVILTGASTRQGG